MNKIRFTMFMFVFGVLFIPFLLATSIDVEINGEEFTSGEEIIIRVEVVNDYSETKTFDLSIFSSVGGVSGFPQNFELTLEPGEIYSFEENIQVIETDLQEVYSYGVMGILNGGSEEEVTEFDSVEYVIVNTIDRFGYINFKVCLDNLCEYPKRLFELFNSPIYLKAFETEGAILTGILTSPDSSVQALTFTDNVVEISLTQLGEYSAEITSSKENYLDYTSHTEFEVVQNIPELIDLTQICNLDGLCGLDETYENCPQDCGFYDGEPCTKPGQQEEIGGFGYYCNLNKKFVMKKSDGISCDNNFECLSGDCKSGECFDLYKEVTGEERGASFLRKLLCTLIHPISEEKRDACFVG